MNIPKINNIPVFNKLIFLTSYKCSFSIIILFGKKKKKKLLIKVINFFRFLFNLPSIKAYVLMTMRLLDITLPSAITSRTCLASTKDDRRPLLM